MHLPSLALGGDNFASQSRHPLGGASFLFAVFFIPYLTVLITFSLFPPFPHQALLLFMGKSLRWFPFLHVDGLYRFIVPCCSVREKLSCCSPLETFAELHVGVEESEGD